MSSVVITRSVVSQHSPPRFTNVRLLPASSHGQGAHRLVAQHALSPRCRRSFSGTRAARWPLGRLAGFRDRQLDRTTGATPSNEQGARLGVGGGSPYHGCQAAETPVRTPNPECGSDHERPSCSRVATGRNSARQVGRRRGQQVTDWVTFVAPLSHEAGPRGPFYAGDVRATKPDSTNPEGCSTDWIVLRRKSLEGRHGSTIQVRSQMDREGRPAICVSGNPAMWFQGHNIFGSDDLRGLVFAMLARLCESGGISPSPHDLERRHQGDIKLSRVDVTRSFDLGSLARVRNALRSLDAAANLKHRGRGQFTGDSLTFGKFSRRSSLTFSAKGAEIEIRGHRLPAELAATQLPAHARRLLRAELRLWPLQLVHDRLDYLRCWNANSGMELQSRFLEKLQIAESSMLDAQALEGLPPLLNATYRLWRRARPARHLLEEHVLPAPQRVAKTRDRHQCEAVWIECEIDHRSAAAITPSLESGRRAGMGIGNAALFSANRRSR